MPGPTGYVVESVTEVVTTGTPTVNHNTVTVVSFSQVNRDDAATVSSATTLNLTTGGWQGTCYIKFVKRAGVNGSGTRRVEITVGGTVIASLAVAPPTDSDADLTVPFTVKVTSGTTLQARIYQSDGAAVAYSGRLWVSRIGAGIQGPVGPEGPQGPPGPKGDAGPVGASGTLSSTTRFSDIGGS